MTRAVLLDAFGTLVALEPPVPRLRAELAARGAEVREDAAATAFAAEIAYYLDHQVEGRDADSLADLRDRCAEVLREALGAPGLDHATAREALLAAIHFAPFPDARPALEALRSRGLAIVVASNWDCSLPEALRETGLLDLVDAVVTSAEAGERKPGPRVFELALERAGCTAAEAVHVGDSPANDVAGAAAVGIRAVLLRRGSERPDAVAADAAPRPRPVAEIASLADLARVL
jgi:putative hydrolase of the HAD superfamily